MLSSLSILFFTTNIQAQYNTCTQALSLTPLQGGGLGVPQLSPPFTNVNATVEASDPSTGYECFGEATPTLDNSTWFTFTGDGSTYFIETVQCNATDYIDDGNTQIALYSGDCMSLTPIGCNENGPTSTATDFKAGINVATEDGVDYYLLVDGFDGADGEFCLQFTEGGFITECSAGNLVNPGVRTIGIGATFTIEATDLVIPNQPTQGEWRWLFTPVAGEGSGALGGEFVFGSINTQNPATYNADLNGVLSGAGAPGPYPPFEGKWLLRARVVNDGSNIQNYFNDFCSTSSDTIFLCFDNCATTVDFSYDEMAMSLSAMPTGGVEPYTFNWSTGSMSGMINNVMPDVSYNVTVTDAQDCTATNTYYLQGEGQPCPNWINPATGASYTSYNDILGAAPCDAGNGCPTLPVSDFEIFASEAYALDYFQTGVTYAFNICDGPGGAGTGAQAWMPEFTIIAPSGNIDAFGPGDGDGCTITWTATEDGTYTIVVNEVGECADGGLNTNVANGYGTLTCADTSATSPACSYPCNAPGITGEEIIIVCGEDSFTLLTDGTETSPANGGFGWSFSDELGGTGAVAGGFTIFVDDLNVTWDADLGGILSGQATPLPPLRGTWVVTPLTYLARSTSPTYQTIECARSTESVQLVFSDINVSFIFDTGMNTATITANSPNPPLTYIWDDPAGSTNATTEILEVSGTYSVTVTDALGCSAVESVQIESTVAVEDVQSLVNIEIVPNPNAGQFNINLELDRAENIQIDLMSITGQKIKTIVNETSRGNNYPVNLSDLPTGLYLVNFRIAGEQFTEKLVIR